jgi:hypothetical protein
MISHAKDFSTLEPYESSTSGSRSSSATQINPESPAHRTLHPAEAIGPNSVNPKFTLIERRRE